jgi:hypothetical protein
MASGNPLYKLSLMETLYIAPRNPKHLEMLGYQPVFWWRACLPYLYMCGRCEWQSNPESNLHMQEESKYRRCISQGAKMTFAHL